MSEHLHAIVRDDVVDNVVVMSPDTAAVFADLPEYADATFVDVQDLGVRLGPGWTRHPGKRWEWRPPQPDPEAEWDNVAGQWNTPTADAPQA